MEAMKLTVFILFGLFIGASPSAFPLMAQDITLKGRVVDRESKAPLSYVTVFVNNTSTGTVANENGLFELKMAAGRHELVLSLMGYENLVFANDFSGDLPHFVFQMTPKPIDLSEWQVDGERSQEWYDNFRIFESYFLGNSRFALGCDIINPEVLVIDFAQSVLKVHSTDFLIIENHQLGYRISYLLTSFELDTAKRKFHYLGYPRYTEMEGGKMKKRRWEKNRSSAYLGSWLHFKRSLRDRTTNKSGFEVKKIEQVPNPDRPSEKVISEARQQLDATKDSEFGIFRDSLSAIVKKESLPKMIPKVGSVLLNEEDYSKVVDGEVLLEFADYLEVTYVAGKVGREFARLFVPGQAPKPPYPISTMSQLSPVVIYPTGLESDPLSVFLEGYWSWQRMGDALPIDYKFTEETN
ncbi:carboxypeptidase-like regulatory domain-containing protein [Cyclobacterium xiamenense]|uniref:carboxypeptidase-like regulatory domain-containing protein n=1 Tax=Cyclobacterium xiamenense TaxID=1297121 RepID=UPI0035CF906E